MLTLNRPEARNSLSEELIAALHAAIIDIGASDPARAVVITGAGTAFSSGHDLKQLTSGAWRTRTAASLVQAIDTFFSNRMAGTAAGGR